MPKGTDRRWDFRGGVNTTFSEDTLDATELLRGVNCRLTTFGAVSKRGGSQRIHTTTLDAATKVLGLVQWDNPSQTGEIVAICGGDLNRKTLAASEFTNTASTLSTTNRVIFAPYKQSGTNRLYFADGTLRKWTATTLTTSIAGAPAAKFLAVYGERMFATDGTSTLYYSKVGDAETWSSASGGGSAPVETYDSEGLVGLAKSGSSLLLFKEDSIARFTGKTSASIQIAKETEGVSGKVGCIAPGTIIAVETFVFFLSDVGPYIADESGITPIGPKIEAEMDDWDHLNWQHSWAVYNKSRREVELHVPDGDVNDVTWVWNVRTRSWTGPWNRTFDVVVACPFERADGTHGILLGSNDGFVRDGDNSDNGAKDDVLLNDTGGTNVEMIAELAPYLYEDAGRVKILSPTQYVHADLGASGSLVVSGTGEERTGTSSETIATAGTGTRAYKFHLAWRGRRPKLYFTEGTSNAVTITGVEVDAILGKRVA